MPKLTQISLSVKGRKDRMTIIIEMTQIKYFLDSLTNNSIVS